MQSKTRIVTAHIPTPLAQRIDTAAARLGRPHDRIDRGALTTWLENEIPATCANARSACGR